MKRLILFVEDDFLKVLEDFKKNINWDKKDLSDEKAMILITRYFMENFNKEKLPQKTLF
jgi:hypothetical protein